MRKKYTINQLKQAMERDLQMCTSDFERSMCRAVCEKEIRERMKEQG